MGAQVGSLYSSLTLESSSFVSGLKQAADATAHNAKEMSEHLNGLGETLEKLKSGFEHFVEFEALRALKEYVEQAIEYAGSLASVSKQLGVTTDDLQTFRYAATQTGISQEDMDKGLQKFTKTLSEARAGIPAAVAAFRNIGFTDDQIKKLDQHEALLKTADGIAQLTDRVTRGAPEITFFGRAGQQLDPLLSQGSKGINGLADAARDLGVVLSEDQIENADRTAHKLEELKMVLATQIASVVADDAAEIMSMITAVEHLVSSLEDVNDRLAQARDLYKMGEGQAYSGFLGQTAALINGGGQVEAGRAETAEASADFDKRQNDIFVRGLPSWARREHDEIEHFGEKHEATGRDGAYTDPAAAAAAQRAREKAAREAEAAATKAAAAAKRQEEYTKRVQTQQQQLDDQMLSAREGMTVDAVERAVIERDKLTADTASKLKQVDTQASVDKLAGLNAAQVDADAAALKLKIQRNADLQLDAINQRENIALEQDAMKVASAHLDDMREEASAQEGLATSNKERLAIALRLLAAEKEAERKQLQVTLDDMARDPDHKRYSPGDVEIAQGRMSSLDSRYDLKEQSTRLQNAGPLEAYRRQITEATADMNQALQSVEVTGLKALDDGLTGVLDGTESVEKAFHNMAASVLADLAKIEIEKEVIGPFSNALFGGGGSVGSLGGFSLDGFSLGGDVAANDNGSIASFPRFATGGSFEVGGIGSTDSQLMQFYATPGEMVNITKGDNDAGRAGTTVHQTVQFSGGVDLATRSEVYRVADAVQRVTLAKIDERARRRG